MSRILVPRARHDEFVAALVEMVARLKVGDPSDPETFIGPMGATVAIGGPGMPDGIRQGAYVRPTVFTHVDNRMRIAREEIFGPVLVVIPYDDIEDAIRIANDSPYGLAGSADVVGDQAPCVLFVSAIISSTVMTCAVDMARIMRLARWTSAALIAP
jgi:acyl-CoA reductase-like NAD-dependent aldehyde dehydrogenase